MAYKSVFTLAIIAIAVAAISAQYQFNGPRGPIIPDNININKDQNNHEEGAKIGHTNSHNTNTNSPNNNKNNNSINYFKPSNSNVDITAPKTATNNNNINKHNDINNINNIKTINSNGCTHNAGIRPVPGSCSKYTICSGGELITNSCPAGTVFSNDLKACIPIGSKYDTCREREGLVNNNVPGMGLVFQERPRPFHPLSTFCPRGATYKKAHPVHCARYYDCNRPAMMPRWEAHEWECKYPYLYNEHTMRCEHYSTVSCGTRKIAYDQCDYKQYTCQGYSHCRPCHVTYPSCRNLPDGLNVWQGRTPSPYYVMCSQNRVVYSSTCSGGQIFDATTRTCPNNYPYYNNYNDYYNSYYNNQW